LDRGQVESRSYLAGDVIDHKYRLVRLLGRGGMGVVWVARNVILDVDIAIKLIALRRGLNRALQTQRMLQEARTAAQLGHPAICRVFDFGETHLGDPFVASELMRGETLADTIDAVHNGPPYLATKAVQTLLPIIDGLAVAHAHGIVHRDVKPDNIFLARDVAGRLQPKLLDFGIARFVERESELTVDGSLLSTPLYMSPELARGEGGTDYRTDVWSVCVVLYELLTGAVPFAGDNYNAILYAVLHRSPQSIVEIGAGDAALWRLISRGLTKDPEDRWQSMRELGEALALWLYEHGVREDVCGASLRSTWLEAGLSDAIIELADSRPPKSWETVRPEAPTLGGDSQVPALSGAQPRARPETLAGSVASDRPWHHRYRRRHVLAVAGASALVVAGLVALGLSAGRAAVPAASPSAASATAPASAPAAREGVPAPVHATPVQSAAAATPAPTPATSASAAVAPAAAPQQEQRKPAARPARRFRTVWRQAPKKLRRDFGF
jgi:serine/threonine-protein kinase